MIRKPYVFCPHCGRKLENIIVGGRERHHCDECKEVFYFNPLPVVSTVLVNSEREVLLVLRKNEPYKNMWCLPMGFAEIDESIQDAALRELEEETGVEGKIVCMLDAQTTYDSYYGNMLILSYEAGYVRGEIKAGDDAEDVRFFPINDIPKLAFDANEKAIREYQKLHKDLE